MRIHQIGQQRLLVLTDAELQLLRRASVVAQEVADTVARESGDADAYLVVGGPAEAATGAAVGLREVVRAHQAGVTRGIDTGAAPDCGGRG